MPGSGDAGAVWRARRLSGAGAIAIQHCSSPRTRASPRCSEKVSALCGENCPWGVRLGGHVAGPRRFAVREAQRFRAWDAHRRARGHRVFWSCRWRPCLVIGHGCKEASVFVTVRLWSARERVSKDRTKRGATFAPRRPGQTGQTDCLLRRGTRPSSEGAKRTERLHGAGREGKRQFRQLGRDKREGQGRANCRGPLRAGKAAGGRCSFRRATRTVEWRGRRGQRMRSLG
ncbi:hypothetical protein ERJ75_001495300 [Trypanosoma vivax]|nr:hypothetical protein ERJ75_001495300 [Trypanosoma vivax]